MHSSAIFTAIGRVQLRWRVRAAAFALAVAGAAFAATIVLSSFAIAIGVAVTALTVAWLRAPRLSSVAAAQLIERRSGGLDNLLVTAAELAARPREMSPDIAAEIDKQAIDRARTVDATRVVPIATPIAVAAAVLIGCVMLAGVGRGSIGGRMAAPSATDTARTPGAGMVVTVTPPAYTRRAREVFEDPLQVTVLAGSRIQIDAGGATLRNEVASESAALELRVDGKPRFLSLIVVPDAPPFLRIVRPGKDTAVAEPSGQIPITIESRDDLGLASLMLRYTTASGGGENVSFVEGEIPLRIARASGQQWQADASLALGSLKLADGDIVVYRAIARDTNPAGTPVQSDQYVIEIGRNAALVDAGFSLPAEEKKYAISQQMVIYKTEQLLKNRPADFLSQSQGIGVEQRMVRAEVVFLGGGEVQDEVEEAAHSHELAEGRLENTGRAEMLRAINFMSRAEAQLNDGRAADALVFERQALASLERALDRRRYFLRTLPDRSRIDAGRRLTGERTEARSWTREQADRPAPTGLDMLRSVMRDVASAAANAAPADASLAARVAAIDPASTELQGAAVAMASAATGEARAAAVQQAMQALSAHALKTFPSTGAVRVDAQPLSGALADELARRPRQ